MNRLIRGAIQRQVPRKPHKPSSHAIGRRSLSCNNYEYGYDATCANCMFPFFEHRMKVGD